MIRVIIKSTVEIGEVILFIVYGRCSVLQYSKNPYPALVSIHAHLGDGRKTLNRQ